MSEKITSIDDVKKQFAAEIKAMDEKARAEGKAEGLTEGATAERERIQGIESHATFGHEELVKEMKFDGKTTPDQAAARILAAENKKVGGKLTEIRAGAPPAQPANAEPPAGNAQKVDYSKMPPEEFAILAGRMAEDYRGEQAKIGRTVSNADAVRHVYEKAGVPLS